MNSDTGKADDPIMFINDHAPDGVPIAASTATAGLHNKGAGAADDPLTLAAQQEHAMIRVTKPTPTKPAVRQPGGIAYGDPNEKRTVRHMLGYEVTYLTEKQIQIVNDHAIRVINNLLFSRWTCFHILLLYQFTTAMSFLFFHFTSGFLHIY